MLVLPRLEGKQKKFLKFVSNAHISLSFLLIWNWNDVRSSPAVPSKTIPDSRPKWAKRIPVFRPKRPKNPTPWGGTYLYSLYKEVPPPPRRLTGFGLLMVQLRYVIAYVFTLKAGAINFYSMCLFMYSELLNCFFSPTNALKNLRHRICAEDVSQAKLRCISPREDIPYDIVWQQCLPIWS